MKQRRFQKSYRESASSYHVKVGNALTNKSSPFSSYKIYQEYPVHLVNKTDKRVDRRLRYDWIIYDLEVVIEVHGQFHYGVSSIGGVRDLDDQLAVFNRRTELDRFKKAIAVESGYKYIELKYSDIESWSEEEIGRRIVELIGNDTIT